MRNVLQQLQVHRVSFDLFSIGIFSYFLDDFNHLSILGIFLSSSLAERRARAHAVLRLEQSAASPA